MTTDSPVTGDELSSTWGGQGPYAQAAGACSRTRTAGLMPRLCGPSTLAGSARPSTATSNEPAANAAVLPPRLREPTAVAETRPGECPRFGSGGGARPLSATRATDCSLRPA